MNVMLWIHIFPSESYLTSASMYPLTSASCFCCIKIIILKLLHRLLSISYDYFRNQFNSTFPCQLVNCSERKMRNNVSSLCNHFSEYKVFTLTDYVFYLVKVSNFNMQILISFQSGHGQVTVNPIIFMLKRKAQRVPRRSLCLGLMLVL